MRLFVVLVTAVLAAVSFSPVEVEAQAEGYTASRDTVARWAFLADAQFEGERPTLRQMIAHLERENVSLLLYGGDTSYGWGDVPADWLDALGPFAAPDRMRFVYGNHDGGEGYRTYQPAGLPDFTWWREALGDVVVVGLDTNDDLAAGSPQLEWLNATLAADADAFVVLMMHKPWWVPNVYHEGDSVFMGDAQQLAELVATHDVDLVLAGHQHYYARHDIDGMPHVIAGPADARTRGVPAEVADTAVASAETQTGLLLDVSACGARIWTFDASSSVLDAFQAPAFAGPSGAVRELEDGRYCLAGEPYPHVRQESEVDVGEDASREPAASNVSQDGTSGATGDDPAGEEVVGGAKVGLGAPLVLVAVLLLALGMALAERR